MPKEEIFTSSPLIKLFKISLKTDSTKFADSFLESPTFLNTASLSVERVVVCPSKNYIKLRVYNNKLIYFLWLKMTYFAFQQDNA